jgi:uncharacterized protein YbjQ (UPF0145 family)
MFNPLVENLDQFTDTEIDQKISELGRKYFISHNPQIQQQIAVILEMYKEEARTRRALAMQRMKENAENGEDGLDSLINIS